MNKISSLLRRVVAWLTERDGPLQGPADPCNWADLPPHHPDCMTCR